MATSILTVPYASQRDNATGTGWRECFSSSCAMVAMFWGKVRSDDEYNSRRIRHGDTTEAHAQIETLRELGLRVSFWQTGTQADLIRVLSAGRPVAVGWLHQGHVATPRGGHWSVIVGADREGLVMHDPMGEPLLVSGGHRLDRSGRNVRCGWFNWSRRWSPEAPGRGWWLDVAPLDARG